MPVTLQDVANLANVSVATASLALNGKAVNAQTRIKVLEAAQKLNYVANSIGKNLISGKTNTIGLYILNTRKDSDLTEECSYFYNVLRGVLNVTEKFGYSFHFDIGFWEDSGNNNQLIQKIYSHSFDGVIIMPHYVHHYFFLDTLEKLHFPYVIYNPNINIDPAKCIFVDHYAGAQKATGYLIDNGFTRIGFINGPENHFDAVNRGRGFFNTLINRGLQVYNEYIANSNFTIQGGYLAMQQIMANNATLPEALFCANDYMAAGAMKALYQMGYQVPRDISIIGYDDTDIARGIFPALTTIQNPTFLMGQLAAERLFDIILEKDSPQEAIILNPKLMVRESCRCIAGKYLNL